MKFPLLLLVIFTSLLGSAAHAQKADEKQLPLAKLAVPVSVSFDSKDVDWLQHGGEIAVSVLVDKKGKITVADLTGPAAPCGELSDDHLVSLRKMVLEAVKKATVEPAADADGNPVDGGMLIKIKVPARSPTNVLPLGQLPATKVINAGVVNGKATSLPKPEYPRAAHAERAGGVVNVEVVIDEKGTVVTVNAIDGHPDLRLTSEAAACKAKFSPTTLQGQPVKVMGRITYNFVP